MSSNPQFEIRQVDSCDLRAVPEKPGTLVGYAAVFNSQSADLGGFKEVIAPGAFTRSLSDAVTDPRALVSHDPQRILGRVSAGTLRLAQDDHGLRFEIDVPDTTYGRDLLESVKRGDIRGASFGFRLAKNGDSF